MDFTEAIGYSLKGHNIPKILTIVLVSMIVGVSVFVVGLALESWAVLLLILPVLLGYSLFVQGYTISVIKSVMDESDVMPPFAMGRDIGRGAVILIASIVYMIPVIAFFACGSFLIANMVNGMSDVTPDEAGMTVFAMFCAMGLLSLVVMFVVNFSLIVGKIRYAAEDSAGALFDFGKNFSTVMSNLGTTIGLLARFMGIAIVFGIFSSVVLNVIGAFFSGMTNEIVYEMQFGNFDAITKLGMPLAIYASLYYTASLAISLMQTFSASHLIAGYGAELGFAPNKLKNDGRSGGLTIVFVVLAVVILMGLVACGTVVVLALLGPSIGNVFSEITRELK